MKRATVRTEHDRPELVAAAVTPDNTDEMSTRVEWETPSASPGDGEAVGALVTTIERETTGGLQATVDDYVTNLRVAESIASDRPNTQP